MSIQTKMILFSCVSFCIAAGSICPAQEQTGKDPGTVYEWPMAAGDASWTSYSPDSRVKPPFRLKWVVKTESCFKSEAAVAGGRVFLKSFQGPMLCLDAETGEMLWERDHNLGFYKNTPVSSDGKRVYVRNRRKNLVALDASNGRLLWNAPESYCSGTRPSAAFADGMVYWVKRDEKGIYLCALSVKDGSEIWKKRAGGPKTRLTAPSLAGDLVLCTSRGPYAAFAHDRRTGREVWRTEGVFAAQALTSDGERAWAAKVERGVVALDVKTGKKLWQWGGVSGRGVFVKAGSANWAPAVAYGGIYCKSYYGYFTVLDPETGKVAWTFDDGAGTGCATPSAAAGFLYFTTGNYRISTKGGRGIYAIDPKTHKRVWEYRTAGRNCARASIAYGRLYVPSNDGRLYCFEPCEEAPKPHEPQPAPGQPAAPLKPMAVKKAEKPGAPADPDKPPGGADWPMYGGCPARCGLDVTIAPPVKDAWKYKTGGSVRSHPVIYGSTVYVGNDSGRLIALDLATGRKKWTADLGSPVRCAPAAADNIVVCGSDNGMMYGFDARNGRKIWEFRTGWKVQASPAIVKDRVVFGSWDGNCYCVRLSDGAEFWRFCTDYEIHAAPAVANNIVYVGTWDWRVYALDLGTGETIEGFGKKISRTKEKWLANRRPSWYLNRTRLGRVEGIGVYRNAVAVIACGDENYGQSLLLHPLSGDLLALSGAYMHKEIMDSNGWAFGAPAFSSRWMYIPYAWKGTGVLDVEARSFLGNKYQTYKPVLNTPLATKDLMVCGTKEGSVEIHSIWNGTSQERAKLLWEWKTPGGRKIGTSPAAGGGFIVIGSDDGCVYAFSHAEKAGDKIWMKDREEKNITMEETLILNGEGGHTWRNHVTVVDDPLGSGKKVMQGELVNPRRLKMTFINKGKGFFTVPADDKGGLAFRVLMKKEKRLRVSIYAGGKVKSFIEAPEENKWCELTIPMWTIRAKCAPGEKVYDITIQVHKEGRKEGTDLKEGAEFYLESIILKTEKEG